MDPRDVAEFARRCRDDIETEKRQHWVRVFQERGPDATLALAHELYVHARRLRPDYPTPRDRSDDLDHHVRLKRLLDRSACAFVVR